MSSITIVQASSGNTFAGSLSDLSNRQRHKPALSAITMIAADILALNLVLHVFPRLVVFGPGQRLRQLSLLALFSMLYWFFDAYPGVSVNSIAEIRRISLANASGFLFISAMFAVRDAAIIPKLSCLSTLVCSIVVTLFSRATIRRVCSRFGWWGYPVVLFGSGAAATSILRGLLNQPHLGLRPVAVLDGSIDMNDIDGVHVFKFDHMDRLASSGVKHAIVAAPELSRSEFAALIRKSSEAFPHLILIPNADFIWKIGADTRDISGVLGIQVRNRLLDRGSQLAKRAIDLSCSVGLILLSLPLMAIISLLIILDSGFPVFYADKRVGRKGQSFRMWKFRTMKNNSEAILEYHLASNSELKEEWTHYQKLREDPRITQVGKLLRRTSLDELPQLWNVLKGEMSLVGPRPILDAQLAKYPEAYSVYARAVPGITGLWQVSGRNRTTLGERLAYDIHYVHNWSVWMDIYLLARTVRAVLTCDGAY